MYWKELEKIKNKKDFRNFPKAPNFLNEKQKKTKEILTEEDDRMTLMRSSKI
jgi:hypothetical protein